MPAALCQRGALLGRGCTVSVPRPALRGRRACSVRAGVLETGTTLAEAAAVLVTLQLLGRVVGAGGREIATTTAASALKGVAAVPDTAMGGNKRWVKLALSVCIDAVGVSSYLLPGLGESTDAGWAPVSALLLQALYGSKLLSAIDFVEEALPFSDIVPTACIGWVLEYTPAGAAVGWIPKLKNK